jgi:hypothetical protein
VKLPAVRRNREVSLAIACDSGGPALDAVLATAADPLLGVEALGVIPPAFNSDPPSSALFRRVAPTSRSEHANMTP